MTITKEELFQKFAPSFNFEKNADELLEIALEKGFLTRIENEDNLFQVNDEY